MTNHMLRRLIARERRYWKALWGGAAGRRLRRSIGLVCLEPASLRGRVEKKFVYTSADDCRRLAGNVPRLDVAAKRRCVQENGVRHLSSNRANQRRELTAKLVSSHVQKAAPRAEGR